MRKSFILVFAGVLMMFMGCSSQNNDLFQTNDPAPPFNLLRLFDNYPSLHEAIHGLDTQRINNGLAEMLNNGTDVPEFLGLTVDMVQAPFLASMIGDLSELIGILRSEDPAHYDYPGLDQGGFYEAEGDGGHLTQAQRMDEFLQRSRYGCRQYRAGRRHTQHCGPGGELSCHRQNPG